MKILIVGGGGREHALAWKLAQSPRVTSICCASGNAGTAQLGDNFPINVTDAPALLKLAQKRDIDLTVVGPDDTLAAGVVDVFQAAGRRIFGPTRAAARLESSKIFAKDFLLRHGIPTAAAGRFEHAGEARAFCARNAFPLVIKADGLAAGKGVIIAEDLTAAERAIEELMERGRFGAAGRRILIEQHLNGREFSAHALLDGARACLMPLAQDYKRAGDGNVGPNTGGMGAISPPFDANGLQAAVEEQIIRPTLVGLRADGLDFRGLLFPGVMLTSDGPKVLEFNARFGDPETQALLPRLRSDLLPALEAAIDGAVDRLTLDWNPRPAVCVILTSAGYPGEYQTGRPISGLENVGDTLIFHAGTARDADGRLVTNGGRVLGVTALGDTLADARARALDTAERIEFEGRFFRRDIAAPAGLG